MYKAVMIAIALFASPADGQMVSLYQTTIARIGLVPVEESIKTFEEIISQDRSFGPAYSQLARMYLELNSPWARQQAEIVARRVCLCL